ncbi:MAG: outer membrane protein [Pseudorhodoplanes sp.]
MGRFRILSIIGFAAASVASAHAADMPALLPPPPVPAATVEEFSSGWYLRGDVGYRMNMIGSASTTIGAQPMNAQIDDSWTGGGGVGYKWRWFRTDVTLDYGTRADFHANSVFGPNDFSARVENFTALWNAYLDLGTWWGFTPYIGGGIGGTALYGIDFVRQSTPTAVVTPRNSNWNFAWAAAAGVGYNLTQNLVIDLGYRYLNLGDMTTEANTFGNQLSIENVSAHEFRVGMRYMFD